MQNLTSTPTPKPHQRAEVTPLEPSSGTSSWPKHDSNLPLEWGLSMAEVIWKSRKKRGDLGIWGGL